VIHFCARTTFMLLVLFGLAAIEFPAHGKLNDDSLGQFTNAPAFTATGTPISAEQISYGYDPGWNLNTRTINGSPQSFPVNDRNQNTGTPYGTPVYDGNGNMTQRGDHRFEYNAENQLIRLYQDYMGTLWKRFDFVYDGLGRKKRTIEYSWSLGSWNYMTETRYVYDGRRVIQERNSSNVPTVAYSRGLDLGQSLEGAGGIGGLLARSHGYSGGSWGTHNYYHADGGGNITALVNSSQTIVASYKYDSFGRTLSLSGTMATANVYRFSSKEIEPNTGYYDYGFRFYDPLAQRWVNRDPIGEAGGINLYGFAGNVPVNCVDPFGLSKFWPWSNWDYNPVQACTHAFFEIGALPVEGLLALIDASDKAFEAGKARGKENDNIDNRISIRAGGDAINSALPGIGGDLRAAIGGIPGTVFSGAPPAPNIPGIVTSVGTMIITTPGSN
jgi:RHS repeat-associated protein